MGVVLIVVQVVLVVAVVLAGGVLLLAAASGMPAATLDALGLSARCFGASLWIWLLGRRCRLAGAWRLGPRDLVDDSATPAFRPTRAGRWLLRLCLEAWEAMLQRVEEARRDNLLVAVYSPSFPPEALQAVRAQRRALEGASWAALRIEGLADCFPVPAPPPPPVAEETAAAYQLRAKKRQLPPGATDDFVVFLPGDPGVPPGSEGLCVDGDAVWSERSRSWTHFCAACTAEGTLPTIGGRWCECCGHREVSDLTAVPAICLGEGEERAG